MQATSRFGPTRRSQPNGNQTICLQLLEKFSPLIQAISLKMGVTYSLAKEDREDLVAQVTMKIFAVDWVTLHQESNGRDPSDYCRSLILNSMRKEVRRIKANGFRGLGTMEVGHIPQPEDVELTESEKKQPSEESELEHAARDLARKAQAVLTPAQLAVVEMLFGFDGGGERSIEQTAKELGISRREVSELSITAIEALRRHLKRRSVSFS